MKNKPIHFGNTTVYPGERLTIALPTPEIYTIAPMYTPIHVIHGKKPGPCLLVCSAMYGDETNGIALIQRLMQTRFLDSLQGTLLAVPVLNTYGLITESRFLPGQRNLDGSFPGSKTGSFASRLAHYINKEILNKADYCIDIHSGKPYHHKLPQIHTDMENETCRELALSFHAPVISHTTNKRGMLWQLQEEKKPTLIYETGEAQRLDEFGIRVGIRGILYLMRSLNMLRLQKETREPSSIIIDQKGWIRTPFSGLCTHVKKPGTYVKNRDLLFRISDPFGSANVFEHRSTEDGIVIGCNYLPLVNEGDPIVEIAITQTASLNLEKEMAQCN
jgi:predicted deacylase